MKSMIKEIFYGNICDEMIKPSAKVMEHYDKLADMQDELKEKLSSEHYELVVKMIDAIELKNCDQVAQYYAEGFKVGLRIGIECGECLNLQMQPLFKNGGLFTVRRLLFIYGTLLRYTVWYTTYIFD